MLKAFLNVWGVKELRTRLLFTALIIVLVRFASNIPCPGVDPAALESYMSKLADNSGSGGLMSMIDLFQVVRLSTLLWARSGSCRTSPPRSSCSFWFR